MITIIEVEHDSARYCNACNNRDPNNLIPSMRYWELRIQMSNMVHVTIFCNKCLKQLKVEVDKRVK